MNKRIPSDNIRDHISGIGLYWLSQIIRNSCRLQIINLEYLDAARNSGRPVIFTGWHGITMMAGPLIQNYHSDMSDFVVLMPDDWRGVALRIWTEKLGGYPYPMNLTGDSTMGMARKVVELTRSVIGGKNLYINPDGPDGPAQVIKPGIIYIARKTNAVIVPMGAYCRRSYTIPRWDRYVIPYPFSRITYHIGDPLWSLPEDSGTAEKLVTDTLNRVTLQAAADYYEQRE